MASLSKPITRKRLLEIANSSEKGPMTERWLDGFRARWQDHISLRKVELLSASRAQMSNLDRVRNFVKFEELYQKKHYFPAHAIFNVDECRVSLNNSKRGAKVLTPKKFSKGGLSAKRSNKHCTVIPFCSAAGETISVFWVYPMGPNQKEVAIPTCQRSRSHKRYSEYYLFTKTGYTNNSTFPIILAEFERDFHHRYPGLDAVVYMDRLQSHVTSEVLATMVGHGLHGVLLPAGTTHFMQPLDDAVFACFKNLLRGYRDEQLGANTGHQGPQDDPLLLAMIRAFDDSVKPGVIETAFSNTGLYPWDSEKILMRASLAYADANSVPTDPACPIQAVIAAIQATSTPIPLVAISNFRKHQLDLNTRYDLADIVFQDQAYYQELDRQEQEKALAKRQKLEERDKNQAIKDQKKLEKKIQREARLARNMADRPNWSLARRQSSCLYCADEWKGKKGWEWCSNCDDVGICVSCKQNPDTLATFGQHDRACPPRPG
jgi:hypothetical protein